MATYRNASDDLDCEAARLDDPAESLRVSVIAAGSLGHESTCRRVLHEWREGDHLAGCLD